MWREMWRGMACSAALACLLLASGQARATDPSTTQAYCDQVQQAALQAEQRYVSTFTPHQDPGQTFDDATRACLSGILAFPSAFHFTLPTMAGMEQILEQMGKQLMLQACQAAADQYNRAVQDALNTVNNGVNTVNQATGVPGVGNVGGVGVGYTSPSSLLPASTPPPSRQPTSTTTVVNLLSNGGKP